MFKLHGLLFDEATENNQGGGGESQQSAFDPTKFRTELKTELLTEIRKDINGIDKKFKNEFKSNFDSLRSDLQTWLKPQGEQHSEENHESNAGAENQGGTGEQKTEQQQQKQDPHVLALQRQVKELQRLDKERQIESTKLRQEAERKEMESLTRTAISNHKFNSDRGPKDLFNLVRGDIKRGEDGNLYGPEGMTLDEYIAKEYNERPFLHPAKQVNGSGAGPSNGGATYGGKALDRDGIRPGMTAEEIAEYGKTLSSAISGRR